ncbi:hypothetical protein [Oleiagrimonas soli]|uniref:Lipoprotein n=2 Tax=Oleiagrimonas soli TaxID=1543381 RepID=A0A099CZ26_9GAMM|nr:hypothetical protein [Oleiagrimonas soli]KGI79238.1 hypothetical protein LF63_0100165 [Oleiagrimonas soli]MBB6184869.1 hypothetical protein [Oleiagrimonas soli]
MLLRCALVLLLCASPVRAADLPPSTDHRLATILGLAQEIAATDGRSEQPYRVRIYAIPDAIEECAGSVASCPDVRLFVSVSSGDLGETPSLYVLPPRKGWTFLHWEPPQTQRDGAPVTIFRVRTALPEANIDAAARAGWKPETFRIMVGTSGGSWNVIASGGTRVPQH